MGSTVFPAASAGFDPTKVTLQQTFNTSSNNVTFPTGVNQVYALVIGAGGSGGASGQSTTMGAGGGGGAIIWGATPTASKVVVGAGGASRNGSSGTTNGYRGGTSSFGTISAIGGGGGYPETMGSNNLSWLPNSAVLVVLALVV